MAKHKRNIVAFLLLTFFLPLLFLSMQLMISNTALQLILYGMEAASPTIAAITILVANRSVKTFFAQMFDAKHFVMAVLIPLIVACFTMFLAKLIFCFLFQIPFALGSVTGSQFVVLLWAFVAEELGWRGYLEPQLQKMGIHRWLISFLIGIVWCLWHYHYFLMDGIQVPFLLFLISCIIESCLYSCLMVCTDNNLISAMTYHFAWNLFVHVFGVNPADNNGSAIPYALLILLEGAALVIFLLINKNKNQVHPLLLTKKTPPAS